MESTKTIIALLWCAFFFFGALAIAGGNLIYCLPGMNLCSYELGRKYAIRAEARRKAREA